jgi:hypothetical protein
MISNAEVCYFQPDGDYRRQPGENQSSLKHILTSPAHYQASKKRRFMPSPVMTIGTATHCKVLEGDKTFEASFVKKPDSIKFTSKEGRDWKEQNSKKTILANDGQYRQWDAVMGMSERLQQLEWFDPSQKDYRKFNEVSIYWDYEDIRCKARLDRVLVLEDEVIVVDLKTTDSVNVDKFQSKLVDLGYDFQAGWYATAAEAIYGKPARFVFVAVERNAPYTVDLFEVPDFMLEEAKRKNELAMKILADCKQTGEYPAPTPVLRKLDYPKWYTPPEVDTMNQTKQALEPLF